MRERVNPPETFTARLLSSFLYDWNLNSKYFELSIDELATIFHPPSSVVLTAPHMQRVGARRVRPLDFLYLARGHLDKFRTGMDS